MKRWLTLLSLVVAGEAIFTLPFHVSRFFRATFLDVFGLTNLELGTLGSAYGVVAMASYVLGGGLADRFSARKLLSASLVATALGGLYLFTIPSYAGLLCLFGAWGLTTILAFWAALIRATREWGGESEQGRAFGLLDGGRGFLAAALASIAVVVFSAFFPDRVMALKMVIALYTASCLSAAVVVWLWVPDTEPQEPDANEDRDAAKSRLKQVLRLPSVWFVALVIVCAYCGYKATDDYALYAVDAYGMTEIQAARLSAVNAWLRPVAAIGAGLLADRLTASRTVAGCFVVLVTGFLSFTLSSPDATTTWVLWLNVMITGAAVYALRGVYFAMLEEMAIPAEVTGTAVGVISFVGYTPDIFIPPLAGWLIDRSPGATGHQHFFAVIGGFCLLGLLAAWSCQNLMRRANA
ncbi:MAG: MFS transporter [Polyangiaceae bacterium]